MIERYSTTEMRQLWSEHHKLEVWREVEILVYDIDRGEPIKKFTLHNAWVSKFTALSDLAGDANEVLIETLELQHEGFTRDTLVSA